MSFFASAKSFDEDELASLTAVYFASCEAAGIAARVKTDLRRETVAHIVMTLAIAGETRPHVIFERTMMHLRRAG